MDLSNVKNTSSKQADFISTEIGTVCKKFGARDSGGKGEKKAMEYMAETVGKYADDVKTESYDVHPGAFMGWIYITVSLVLAALVCSFFLPILSIVFIVIGMLVMILEFVCYFQVVDFMWPKKQSQVITAIKKPTGEVKRRIYFTGHTDAAYEWTVNSFLGGKWFIAHFLISIVGVLYLFGVSIATTIIWAKGGTFASIMTVGSTTFIPSVISLLFFPLWVLLYDLSNPKVVAPGANDNLTGTYLSISILKALKEAKVDLENTEVGIILAGSEECGLRGSKAWAKMHAKELLEDEKNGIPTKIVVFDTICEDDYFMTNVKDLNGFVKSDDVVAKMVNDAFDELEIKHTPNGSVPLGATDSAAFSQAGLDAVAVTAMNHDLPIYYHTRHDKPELVNPACLEKGFKVAVQIIQNYDDAKYDK